MRSVNRRRYLTGTVSLGTLLLAGCVGGDDDGSDGDDGETGDTNGGGSDDGEGTEDGSDDGEDTEDGSESGDYDKQIQAGWAEEGGAGFTLGQVVATLLDQNSDFGMDVGATSGAANMRRLDQNDYDIGYTNSHVYSLAYDRKDPFDDPPIEQDIWQIFGVFDVEYFFIARSDANVETIADFAGKDVTIYTPAASMHLAARDGLENVGVYGEMNERQYSVSNVPRPFESGEVDVAMAYNVIGDITPSWVQELTPQLDDDEFNFVKMTDEEAEMMGTGGNTMIKHTPSGYYSETDPPEIWASRIGYNQHAPTNFPDDLMYDFLEELHGLSDEAQEENPLAARLGTQEGFELLLSNYPIHPGAAEFYRDQGWWSDDWTEGTR